ncbi:MAG: hypothetical protein M0R80_12480 [Proteobacteria bacterium]|jgi:hypothetical protein|nr:hypothetical protein [Pseudomonadota bacterium]
MEDHLLEEWRAAARDLGLEIVAPYRCVLPSGAQLNARLLLKHFGYTRGMIVVTDYSVIADIWKEVGDAGYGFSTLSEPEESVEYDRDSFIDMLRDWGWSGLESQRPKWCTPVEEDDDEE